MAAGVGLLANLDMMFQTDMRILGGARVLATIAIATFPPFVAARELVLWLDSDPLAAFFKVQYALSLSSGRAIKLHVAVSCRSREWMVDFCDVPMLWVCP